MDVLVNLALVLLFVLVGGFFAAAEMALVTLRPGQVGALAERGRRGRRVARLRGDSNRFLSAVQIGVTFAGFFASSYGGATIAARFQPLLAGWGLPLAIASTAALVVVTALVSYLSLILGELVPKRLALQKPEAVSLVTGGVLDRFATLTRPLIWLLSRSTNAVVRVLGIAPRTSEQQVSEQELREMVRTSSTLTPDERRLISDAFTATDRVLREIMVPRTEVDFLDATQTLDEATAAVADQPHSRYPVVGDDEDDVVGVVHVRDLLAAAHAVIVGADHATLGRTVAELARPVPALPGSKPVLAALGEMRDGGHLAVVIDESGAPTGSSPSRTSSRRSSARSATSTTPVPARPGALPVAPSTPTGCCTATTSRPTPASRCPTGPTTPSAASSCTGSAASRSTVTRSRQPSTASPSPPSTVTASPASTSPRSRPTDPPYPAEMRLSGPWRSTTPAEVHLGGGSGRRGHQPAGTVPPHGGCDAPHFERRQHNRRRGSRGGRDMRADDRSGTTGWPSLRVAGWTATRDTLHMWTQIVGKIRMAHAPLLNHWWQVTLYVSPRGLTTSTIPHRSGAFEIEFDFVDHQLAVRSSDGGSRSLPLRPMPVAEFYQHVLDMLDQLGIEAPIRPSPNEVDPAIPFAEDHEHASYDGEAAGLFWRQLLQADRVIGEFRSHFVGKVSPVHFFWGAMDLACTRFSGRPAPPHPGGAPNCGDWVMVEGYSRELSSCGFWPGGGEEGAFYSYAYPEPDGFRDYPVGPAAAYFNDEFGQFLLPYDAVRTAPDPDRALTEFLHTTYEAAAERADWDRAALEDDPSRWGDRIRR